MTQHSWKPYNFIKLKTGWQRNILGIHLFNKTAISIDDILNPGPEPLAGLWHGAPGEGTHHLPDLPDLSHALVVKLCSDPKFWNAPQNILQGCRQGSWEARSPSHTPPWGSSWANPASSSCCRQGRLCSALCVGLFPCSYLSLSHKFTYIGRLYKQYICWTAIYHCKRCSYWSLHSSQSHSWYVRREVQILSRLLSLPVD